MTRKRSGKNYTWQIADTPIGSGDAGEVYEVSCQENPDLTGVMKTPARVATSGTIQRQSEQIAREGLALAQLDGIPRGKAHTPRLLDEALDFTQGTANYFIVSETAPGVDLATLLAQTRQSGKPFPRRVLITVLDALFDLFARAHRLGILWNDVKLDHIYWHNTTGKIGVIDWGNAIFLNNQVDQGRPILPRWQDYQQMVETLGGFLQQNAPELFTDLGWEEFQGIELDSPQVSVLARRIAYQQQVVSLDEMEYQSLLRVILSQEPSLEGLQKVLTYQKKLEQIGAPWPQEDVLQYGKALVETSVAAGDFQTGIQCTRLIWDLFDEDLTLSWHLLREYFRQLDLLTHPNLAVLIKDTLAENWLSALWALVTIAQDLSNPSWYRQLVPVLRQKALGMVSPPPYQLCQSLKIWYAQQNQSQYQQQSETLASIIKNWHRKGWDLTASPFDYDFVNLFNENQETPDSILSELKQSYAIGKQAIRDLLQKWVDMNWEGLEGAFQRFLAWDPDRWGILNLEKQVQNFRHWLIELHKGPTSPTTKGEFFENALDKRPHVEKVLGKPIWMKELLQTLRRITQNEPIQGYQREVNQWCPWLFDVETPPTFEHHKDVTIEHQTDQVLSHFRQHLKSWTDIEAGLQLVNEKAPQYYPVCQQIVDQFNTVLSLNFANEDEVSICEPLPHPGLGEACQVLQTLLNWRLLLQKEDLEAAESVLLTALTGHWKIIDHCKEKTQHWHENIQPYLQAVQNFTGLHESLENVKMPEALVTFDTQLQAGKNSWENLIQSGVYGGIIENLVQSIDAMYKAFFTWRQSQEHSEDRVARLLYHAHSGLIQRVSADLVLLSQHSHQTAQRFKLFQEIEDRTSQLLAMENIMDHLGAMEAILINDKSERRFPAWQRSLISIQGAESLDQKQQMVLALPEDFPLYAILVQSIFDK